MKKDESKNNVAEKIAFKLNDIELFQVDCVYVGKPDDCMCGCRGRYTYTKINQKVSSDRCGYKVTVDEVDDKRVMRVLNKMRKNSHLGVQIIKNRIFTVVVGATQYTLFLVK